MKKIKQSALFAALILPLFTGCEFLQGTLSSTMQEKLAEETGNPSYSYKVWYYNGCASSDMTEVTDNEFYAETLKIDFGKKVTVGSLNGSISVSYTDTNGNTRTDVTKDIRGNLSADFTSYYLDMSYVINHFDMEEVTSGTASVDIKLSGFICAEGEQKGRKLNAFEFSKLQVKPLFNATEYTLSTIGFDSAKYPVPLNAEVALENTSVTGTDSSGTEYEFALSVSDTTLYLTPKFSEPADGTVVSVPLTGIVPAGTGNAYSKELTVTFTEHLVVIDGIFDDNYDSSYAVNAQDETGDSVTDTYEGATDLTGIYVTNDDDYLYVALKGALTVDWYDGLIVMLSKDHSFDASSAAGSGQEGFGFVSSVSYGRETLAHGKPDFYMNHRPRFDALTAYVENASASPLAALDVSSEIGSSVTGASAFSGSFIEYAIPMSVLENAGIVSGDTVRVIGAFSAHWDDGIFLSDAVPNEAVTLNETHSTATVNFQKALSFTLN